MTIEELEKEYARKQRVVDILTETILKQDKYIVELLKDIKILEHNLEISSEEFQDSQDKLVTALTEINELKMINSKYEKNNDIYI